MRKPFAEAEAALKASGYKLSLPLTSSGSHLVFGGEVIAVVLWPGGGYHNRGFNYVRARLTVRVRGMDEAGRRALTLARARFADRFAAIEETFPRSDAQARTALELAADLDRLTVGLLPEVKAELAVEEAQSAEAVARRQNEHERERLVATDLVAEVLSLEADGLLDGNDALGGLKNLATRIRALGG